MKPDPKSFSDLDNLYTQILSVYPSAVNIVQVLGIIVACENNVIPEVIEDILGMEKGELKLVLRGLSSLMVEDKELVSYIIPPFAHASFRDYLFDSSRSGPFYVNRREYGNQVTIRSFALILQSIRFWRQVILMIFSLLIIHSCDRRSSITRVPQSRTWDYFASHLLDHFILSSKVVKEAIMTDIYDLVQEFWRTSTDGAHGGHLFAMRRLHEILRRCLEVCFC